jgi:hypothetical protein
MVKLYIVTTDEFRFDDSGVGLHVLTTKGKLREVVYGEEEFGKVTNFFYDIAGGKAKDDPIFQLKGAKVGDVVWIGYWSLDEWTDSWITAPCWTEADARKALETLREFLPEEVREKGAELYVFKATIK